MGLVLSKKFRNIKTACCNNSETETLKYNNNNSNQCNPLSKQSVTSTTSVVTASNVSLSSKSKNTAPTVLPRPEFKKFIYRALYTYEGRDSNELSFEVGDILKPLENPAGKIWFQARNSNTGLVGFAPYNYVVAEDGSPTSLDAYYDVCRVDAERFLQVMGNPSGTYLIRPCAEKPNLALSVRKLENEKWCVRHYMIRKTRDNKWFINGERIFTTLKDLIKYLENDKSSIGLTKPLPRNNRPVVPFKDLEVDRTNFIKQSVLGRGHFGEVWKARWGEQSRMLVALKVVLQTSSAMTDEQFLEEAKTMHRLRHPRIVELLGISTKPVGEPIFIITEYLTNGALLDYLHTYEGQSLKFPKLVDIMQQVSEGMAYLESQKYVHRDLRAANILVDENTFVKVADFGLARIVKEEDDTYAATESKFPVRWTAPEASRYNLFTIKSDVWSFGILSYEIITYGRTPYFDMQTKEVRRAVEQDNYRLPNPHDQVVDNGITVYCPSHLYEMMMSCWNTSADARPTFEYLYSVLSDWAVSNEGQYD